MFKRYIALLSIIWLSLLGFIINPTPVQSQTSGWIIKQFDADIAIQPDGLVRVEETITVDFGALNKHGIYRDIPFAYSSDEGSVYYTEIDVETVTKNQQSEPFELSHNDNQLRIRIGDPDRTISGPQVYGITYLAKGVLRSYDQYDELYWNVTGNEWEVPIEQARATISVPADEIIQISCYQGELGATDVCTMVEVDEQQARIAASQALLEGEGLTVAVGYTKGMVPILVGEKPKGTLDYLLMPVNWVGFIGVVVVGVSVIAWLWWRQGRDHWWPQPSQIGADQAAEVKPIGAHETVVVEYTPPDGLPPGLLGVLKDESADTIDATASIIDLASKGYLTIKELDKTWMLGAKDYEITRTEKTANELLPYESLLLKKLFANGNTIKLSSLKNSFYQDLAKIKDQLYQDAMSQGWFPHHPSQTRTLFLILGLMVGIGTLFGGFYLFSRSLYLPGLTAIGAAIVGFVLAGFSQVMSRRTAQGREMYRRLRGYELFIKTAEQHRQRFFEQQNLFHQSLPYAMMFGLTEKFAEAMKQIGYQPSQPGWFYGLHAFHPVSFGRDMEGVSKAISSTMASTPSSSGSGGGGSSGGGFGGGGGGSW